MTWRSDFKEPMIDRAIVTYREVTPWNVALHPELHPSAYHKEFPLMPPTLQEPTPIQHITGVLYRSNEAFEARDVHFHTDIWYPLLVNFDETLPPIGRVRVRHSSLNELTVEGELYQLAPNHPKLAASIQTEGVPSYGKLIAVGVCRENMDHSIPPYQLHPIQAPA